jgi:hypothetical protein
MTSVDADIFLAAPLNDPSQDWRDVAGRLGDYGSRVGSVLRILARENEDIWKRQGGEPPPPPVSFGLADGRPVAVLSNYLSTIFPEGSEHHDWAWEHGDLVRPRYQVRRNEYIIGYRFPSGCTSIPHVDELRRRAEADVKQLITEAYANPIPPGQSYHPHLGDRKASFSGPFDAHQGKWREAIEKMKRGEKFPYLTDDGRGNVKLDVPQPESGRSWSQRTGQADMDNPAQKKTGLNLLAGASVAVGAMLFLHGVTTAWALLRQPNKDAEQAAASLPGSSSSWAGNNTDPKPKIAWRIAEAGAGAGLVLAGVIGLYGRGR